MRPIACSALFDTHTCVNTCISILRAPSYPSSTLVRTMHDVENACTHRDWS